MIILFFPVAYDNCESVGGQLVIGIYLVWRMAVSTYAHCEQFTKSLRYHHRCDSSMGHLWYVFWSVVRCDSSMTLVLHKWALAYDCLVPQTGLPEISITYQSTGPRLYRISRWLIAFYGMFVPSIFSLWCRMLWCDCRKADRADYDHREGKSFALCLSQLSHALIAIPPSSM